MRRAVWRPAHNQVGPDNPLALGIVDLFQQNGLYIWGCNRKAAQFESSKVFSQNFMAKYDLSTDAVQCYDETSCATGSFGTIHGDVFIRAVFGK